MQWEERKAWDVLLEAFYSEFVRAEGVVLYLLTNAYHNEGTDFSQLVQQLKARVAEKSERTVNMLPIVEMIETRVPQERLPSLFAAMDGFVLPSRGEGWGRPHVPRLCIVLSAHRAESALMCGVDASRWRQWPWVCLWQPQIGQGRRNS